MKMALKRNGCNNSMGCSGGKKGTEHNSLLPNGTNTHFVASLLFFHATVSAINDSMLFMKCHIHIKGFTDLTDDK